MIAGLTGGIGSGKSAVAQLFRILGAEVYDTDRRARDMYLNPEVKREVIMALGEEAYDANGSLNRPFVAGKIFSDATLIKKINAIIHPAVGRDFKSFTTQHEGKLIIKETALLFEAGLLGGMDQVILVTAPVELKIRRIQKRDKLSVEQINERLKNQWPDSGKIEKSNFVIVNDEQQAVIPQVIRIYNELSRV